MNLYNIEKSKFKPKTYIGYGLGGVFHITKIDSGWRAWSPLLRMGIQAKYLREISKLLEATQKQWTD